VKPDRLPPVQLKAIGAAKTEDIAERLHGRYWFYFAWLATDLPEGPKPSPESPASPES
jgi:hypothetical protein